MDASLFKAAKPCLLRVARRAKSAATATKALAAEPWTAIVVAGQNDIGESEIKAGKIIELFNPSNSLTHKAWAPSYIIPAASRLNKKRPRGFLLLNI
jgi:hypothetical protein